MRHWIPIVLVFVGCGGGGAKSPIGGGGTGGPAIGPGPGVTGGGQVGGGTQGGTGPAVTAMGESSYWLQNTSLKVQPSTAPGTMGGTVTIEGARGAVESYQIVLRGALSGIDAVPSDLSDGAGHSIQAGYVSLFREAFIDFTNVSTMGGTKPAPASSPSRDGLVPDALIPFHDPYTGAALGAPFNVAAGKNQPIWVDVRIPIDQPYGTYTGSITFTPSSGAAIVVPLAVTVWNITIPDMRAVPAWFQMDYNYIEQYHQGVHDCYYSNCASNSLPRQIIKRYQELLHEHRVDPRQTLIQYPNGCDNTNPDFSDYDSGMAAYMDGSYWDDGVPSSLLEVPLGPGGSGSELAACGQAKVAATAAAWSAHLKDKGWFDRAYVYGEDEPPESDYPAIAQQAGWMNQGDPNWRARIFETTIPTASSTSILDPGVGIFVVCLKCYESWYYTDGSVLGRSQWATRLQQGKGLWFYESNAQGPPYPGLASNTLDAAEPRIMMWGSWYEGGSGFLYWAVDAWDDNDPWGPTIGFNKTGDGVIIYPGDHSGTNTGKGSPSGIAMAGPVPSIRLKMTRAGLQDWALFLLADRTGKRDAARAEVAKVYSQMGGCDYTGCNPANGSWYWKTDYDLMSGARRNVVTALLGP
jgi:Domain of unknown function (DUF4091)/Family of unknown function (DUF6067)